MCIGIIGNTTDVDICFRIDIKAKSLMMKSICSAQNQGDGSPGFFFFRSVIETRGTVLLVFLLLPFNKTRETRGKANQGDGSSGLFFFFLFCFSGQTRGTVLLVAKFWRSDRIENG